MSNPPKKASAQPPEPAHEAGAFIDDEVVHVPKGKSPLQFYLVLALMLFVLVVFTVGDQLGNSLRGGGSSGDSDRYMTWTHPEDGVQTHSYPEMGDMKRRLENFYYAQRVQTPRGQLTDEAVANLMITDRLARDAGIEIADAELGRMILEGEQPFLQGFFNAQNYVASLDGARISATKFEATARMLMRSARYQSMIGLSLAQPEPDGIERLWMDDHQEYAFDLVRLPVDNLRAEAEAQLPDAAGMAVWYDGLSEPQRQLNFSDSYLPERYAVALLSWDASTPAPAALLAKYPRPEGTDMEILGRAHYDRFLARRYLKPADEEEAGEDEAEEAAAEGALDDLYLPYADVADGAKVEAEVQAAMTDMMADLRARLAGGEDLDLAALADEYGLVFEGDGLPRSRDEWSERGDPYLADSLRSSGPNGLLRTPIVGEERLWVGRVLESRPVEPPLYADVAEAAREIWLTDKTAELARAQLDELRASLDTGADDAAEDEAPESEDPAALLAAADAPVTAELDAFQAAASAAGLTVVQQDWFDPSQDSDVSEDEQSPEEAFLRSVWYPGVDLFALEEGQVAAPRAGPDDGAMWLVRSAGVRDPEVVDMLPSEYDVLRQRALYEELGEVYQAMTSAEDMGERYGLAFPGRISEDS